VALVEPDIQPPTDLKRRKRPRRLSPETTAVAAAAAVVISNVPRLGDLTVYELKRLVATQLQKRPHEGIDGVNLGSKTVDELLEIMLRYSQLDQNS
jgi:hypothetical protein